MSVEPKILRMIEKFEHRVERDEHAREKVMPVDKTVNIDLGEEKYSFRVKDAAIHDYKTELLESADVTVITTPEYLTQLVDGDLRPMKAYVTKRVQIKGKIQDILHLKSLF